MHDKAEERQQPEERDASYDLAFSQPVPGRSEMSKIVTPSRGKPPKVVVLLIISLALSSLPSTAAAGSRATDDARPLINYSATTRPAGTFTLGLWDIGYSPLNWLTLETYTWPWLRSASNGSLKVRLFKGEAWTLSAKLGAIRLDLQAIADDAPETVLWSVPVEIATSWRANERWRFSGTFVYTSVIQDGSYESDDLEGAAGYSNSQLTLEALFQLSPSWSLFVRSRHLLSIEISGEIETQYQLDNDPYTTIETHASAGSDDLLGMGFPQTWQVVPGIAYVGDSFFVEAGLGYGNFSIPGLNFFIPSRSYVPQLDLGWRW
jgi:hypothetical protein